MSDALYPTLAGLTFPVQKTPITASIIQTTASGQELRSSFWSSPLFEWGLKYDVLRTNSIFGVTYTEYEELAWSGTFSFRVRFRDDKTDFVNFLQHLWDNQTIWLRQLKGAVA